MRFTINATLPMWVRKSPMRKKTQNALMWENGIKLWLSSQILFVLLIHQDVFILFSSPDKDLLYKQKLPFIKCIDNFCDRCMPY